VNSNITWRFVTVADSSWIEKMLIAEGRISFLQIVTSDFDSALWFSLQRDTDHDLFMYTNKHGLYFGIWFRQLRAEFEPGVSGDRYIPGVSGGIINILGGGSRDSSE
jgi:hypothetical protein